MAILDEVFESDFRKLVERIWAAADLPKTVGLGVFRLAQAEHKHDRNVVWVPMGGGPVEDSFPGKPTKRNQRSIDWLVFEDLRIEARITGCGDEDRDGFEDGEWIRRNLLAAFHQVAIAGDFPGSMIGNHQWNTQQSPAEAAHAYGGKELVVQAFTVRMPIAKRSQRTVTIVGHTHSCDLLPSTATASDVKSTAEDFSS